MLLSVCVNHLTLNSPHCGTLVPCSSGFYGTFLLRVRCVLAVGVFIMSFGLCYYDCRFMWFKMLASFLANRI